MSFNTALSGISAAQTDLDTTSNNIANVNTVGFKESRAEFDSVYASSLFSNSATKVGDGTSVSAVAQQFHQGSLKFTDNPLDLAITGSGFFATASDIGDKDLSYTRAGTFKLNDQNFVVDNSGNYLQSFPVNEDGTSSSVSLSTTKPIQIPETAGTPVATSKVDIGLNLPAGAEAKDVSLFDPNDPDTYNNATSITIYDSLGESHVMSTYYVKPDDAGPDAATGAASQWVSFVTVEDENGIKQPVSPFPEGGTYTTSAGVVTPATAGEHTGSVLKFDNIGSYIGSSPSPMTLERLGAEEVEGDNNGAGVLSTGTDGNQSIIIDYNNPTQFASAFEVTGLEQDGLTAGRLTGVEIGNDGLVKASYSNGTSEPLARVAMVRFRNEQGLAQSGSSWNASQSSGDPLPGEAGEGSFGLINSAALEQSNVDLTTELVDLISAQRNFQANSRSLEISNELQQTILQIR